MNMAINFVFLYIWFHVGSFFMALVSIFMIVLSFPVTQVIYSLVLQIAFNNPTNSITLFIVLGIAADNIFVFADAWKQSENYPAIEKDPKRRMAYAFRRAQKSIAVTSSTTCVAFLSNALSDLVPIQTFGIFAAIIIPVNYLLMIFMTPPAMWIYETTFKNRCNCFRACCKAKDNEITPVAEFKGEQEVGTKYEMNF